MGRPGPAVSATESEAGTSSFLSPSPILRRIDDFDKQLSLTVHGGGSVIPRWLLQLFEYSGDGLLSIPLTAALWLAPILLDKPELRSFLFNLFVALMFDLVLIGLIKATVRRARPVYNKGMYLILAVDHYSFPSGHSSRALLLGTFFWLYQPLWRTLFAAQASTLDYILQQNANWGGIGVHLPPFEKCVAIFVFAWALATATSRILLGRHYVFDVLVGALLGILEALFVHRVLFVPRDLSQSLQTFMWGIFKQA